MCPWLRPLVSPVVAFALAAIAPTVAGADTPTKPKPSGVQKALPRKPRRPDRPKPKDVPTNPPSEPDASSIPRSIMPERDYIKTEEPHKAGSNRIVLQVVRSGIKSPSEKPAARTAESFVVPPQFVAPGVPARPREAEPDEFLDVAAVGGPKGYGCTGVLVAPRWVLTARHCLPATRVLFGGSIKAGMLVTPVLETVVPPDGAVDLALLRIATSPSVTPRTRRTPAATNVPAGLMRIVGFGASDADGALGAGVKRTADVPVFGWGCDEARATAVGCRPGGEMILGRHGEADTCNGDSGGPMFERDNGSFRLIAVTSRPLAGAVHRCGDGGIYTRVDRAATWIDGVLSAKER